MPGFPDTRWTILTPATGRNATERRAGLRRFLFWSRDGPENPAHQRARLRGAHRRAKTGFFRRYSFGNGTGGSVAGHEVYDAPSGGNLLLVIPLASTFSPPPPDQGDVGALSITVTNLAVAVPATRSGTYAAGATVRSVGGLSGVFDQKRAFRFLYRRWSVASPRRQSQVPHPVNRLSGQELGKPHVRHCYALL